MWRFFEAKQLIFLSTAVLLLSSCLSPAALMVPHTVSAPLFTKPYETQITGEYTAGPFCLCNSYNYNAAFSLPAHIAIMGGGQYIKNESHPLEGGVTQSNIKQNYIAIGTYFKLKYFPSVILESYAGFSSGQLHYSGTDYDLPSPNGSDYSVASKAGFIQINVGKELRNEASSNKFVDIALITRLYYISFTNGKMMNTLPSLVNPLNHANKELGQQHLFAELLGASLSFGTAHIRYITSVLIGGDINPNGQIKGFTKDNQFNLNIVDGSNFSVGLQFRF